MRALACVFSSSSKATRKRRSIISHPAAMAFVVVGIGARGHRDQPNEIVGVVQFVHGFEERAHAARPRSDFHPASHAAWARSTAHPIASTAPIMASVSCFPSGWSLESCDSDQ